VAIFSFQSPPRGAVGAVRGGAGGAAAAEAATKADSAVACDVRRDDMSTERLPASGQYANTVWLPNGRRLA
jgi:hypothetical protein